MGGTLTGGSLRGRRRLNLAAPQQFAIVTDDADVILSGAGWTIQDLSSGAEQSIELALRTIGKTGQLHLLSGASFTTAAVITNKGQLELGGGTLTFAGVGSSLTNDGTLYGFGTIDATKFTSKGTLEATGGTLTLSGTSTLSGEVIGSGALALTGGTTTVATGATVTVANLSETGVGTKLTIAEALSYGGAFSEGAGSAVSISTGDSLTLTGTSSLSGKVAGAGTFALAGGSTTIGSGASLSVADWSVSGASVTLDENLAYAQAFSAASGATLDLSGGNLSLTGTDSFAGATTSAKGTTAVSGLTIGGTTTFDNTGSLTESGGDVTLGDAAGDVAKLLNGTAGTWDITDDSGIGLGSSTLSSITNSGLFEKTGGTGTSVIAPKFANNGQVLVTSGTLDFQLAVTGGTVTAPATDTISGASTLEFDSTVASKATAGSQDIQFAGSGGTLDLTDPKGFWGEMSNFAAGDAIDILGNWTLSGFSENPGGTLATLTLDSGTTKHAIEFVGDYTASDFHIASGATTVITYA
jgi:hypothetical protein